MTKRENVRQFLGFCLVGILNNVIAYGVYILCIWMGIHYILANVCGFLISVLNSYYWNNKYVFYGAKGTSWWKKLFRTYVSYASTGIVLSNFLLIMWVEVLDVSTLIAPLITLVVTVPINFLLNKYWAFRM
ncbi:GtrA family protein [Selenomonas ruminantium]|uniref:Putative flippase GtrA (Transmembrane translocase of bactoprenol-linked glucose) n=1 Tax=Selenomonas ruminantium TaxID=971 RepID=A0A1K1PIF0_SELRU|nr:Putative flippase GtrA (transmembrane translocase of bactoprenol-linked glucose) [Selenomonas ruminantium]